MSASARPMPPHPVLEAVRGGDYERAGLRVLFGLLVALEETAPAAREELLGLMAERRAPHRVVQHGDEGHR